MSKLPTPRAVCTARVLLEDQIEADIAAANSEAEAGWESSLWLAGLPIPQGEEEWRNLALLLAAFIVLVIASSAWKGI